jgi:hypothetical protein
VVVWSLNYGYDILVQFLLSAYTGSFSINNGVTLTGTTDGSTGVITGLSSTVGLAPGMLVSGIGIPSFSQIITINSGTSVTISQNTTAPGTVSLIFAQIQQLGITWGEIGTNLAPGAAPTVATGSSGVLTGAYQYLVTFTTASGETTAGPASATVNPASQEVALSAIPTGIAGTVTGRNIYRTLAGGSTFYLLASLADNTTTTYTDNTADASLPSTQPPGVSTAGSINPMNTDTALTNPTNRTTISYAADNGFNTAEFQFFFPDASLPNETYYEFGTFVGGNASIGSGNMFNHALFTNPYSKSAGVDTTVECDLEFESSASGEFDNSDFG